MLVGALVCALMIVAPASAATGIVFAWGNNFSGQLGDGTTVNSDRPVQTSELSKVSAVSAGPSLSLALLSDGTVMAWGENSFGELGDGTTSSSDVPVTVTDLSQVTAIAAGGDYGLALLKNGTVMAWGANDAGQLGNGTTTSSDVPVAVRRLSEVTAIAAGSDDSFALLRNGTVMAWGYNEDGALGKGTFSEEANPTPAPVSGLTEVTAIAAGGHVASALLKNGSVMDWGAGGEGQLGNGTTSNSDVPVTVSELDGVVALPNGGESMARLGNGAVMDWGNNFDGELGNGTHTNSDVPVAVSGLSGVTAIAGDFDHRLAVLSDGTIMAWGNGFKGQLGDESTAESDVPVSVGKLTRATTVAAGEYSSLAIDRQEPHYYRNAVMVPEGQTVPIVEWGQLSLALEPSGSRTTCEDAAGGYVENPVGGGDGVGQTSDFTSWNCSNAECPPGQVTIEGNDYEREFTVDSQNRPWPNTLIEESAIRTKSEGVRLFLACVAHGSHRGPSGSAGYDEEIPLTEPTACEATTEHALEPSDLKGTSPSNPSGLVFDANAGTLSCEDGSIAGKFSGHLKVMGFKASEVIAAKVSSARL